jgi:alpha-L-arabinofuranosidase
MLHLTLEKALRQAETAPVTTERLGKTRIAELPYVSADGSPLTIDTDYLGQRRSSSRPTPGPFEKIGPGARTLRVW